MFPSLNPLSLPEPKHSRTLRLPASFNIAPCSSTSTPIDARVVCTLLLRAGRGGLHSLHPGGNPGPNLKSISRGNRWFLQSTPIQMPPESGGVCGICPWSTSRVVTNSSIGATRRRRRPCAGIARDGGGKRERAKERESESARERGREPRTPPPVMKATRRRPQALETQRFADVPGTIVWARLY